MGTERASPLGIWQRIVVTVALAVARAIRGTTVEDWLRRRIEQGVEFTRLDVTMGGAGKGLDGLRIAYLSDLHVGAIIGEAVLARLFERVAAEAPDLVVFGGDLIEHDPGDIHLYRRPLQLLRPPLGIFAVPGNHEYHCEERLAVWRAGLESAGVRPLVNEGVSLERRGARLWLAGVDDPGLGRADLTRALAGRAAGDPSILLVHRPDFWPAALAAGVDLTLAGHTHGGQVRLGRWTPFKHSRLGFWNGRYERDGSTLYVGRGAGVTTLPIRIGVRGEVPIIRLRCGPGGDDPCGE